jgi:tRNA A22 N-methylase
MSSNMHIETLVWLNKQIDDIHAQSVLVGELLMDEDDPKIIKKYDKKLQQLERELDVINNKIEAERRMITDCYEG